MAVTAEAEGSEAQMSEMLVTRTDVKIAVAVISPFTVHMDHSFRAAKWTAKKQTDCYGLLYKYLFQ